MYGEVKSVDRGCVKQDGFMLTHREWHNGYGPCPETGLRSLLPCGKYGDFKLFQHGYWDFDKAGEIILKAAKKQWHEYRIDKFLENYKTRYKK